MSYFLKKPVQIIILEAPPEFTKIIKTASGIINFDTQEEYHKNIWKVLAEYNPYDYDVEYPEYSKCDVTFIQKDSLPKEINAVYICFYAITESKCRWVFKI
jgi:hypothetical protein